MQKKIAIVGTVGVPAKYGGFETLTEQLVSALKDEFIFTVYCSGLSYKNKDDYTQAKRVFIPLNANGKTSIIYDFLSIIHAVFYADVILLLGVSAAFMVPVLRLFTTTEIITNIDGLEWKRDKWKGFAKKYLKLQEKIAVKNSHVVIADNKAIQNYVKENYKKDSKLIAYGGSHVKSRVDSQNNQKKYAFSVCRIEPENNVHITLQAFSETRYKLVFVGNWKANPYGKNLKEIYNKFPNLNLLDPIYDQEKLDKLRKNSTIYIHGHSAGGTNPSLVEAMWLGLPVFCWDVVYNRESTESKTLFFNSVDSLKKLLSVDNERLAEIAIGLKNIANKKYNWATILNQYKELFNGGALFNTPIKKVMLSATIVLYKNDIKMLRNAVESFLKTPIDKKLFLIDNSPTNILKKEFNHPDIEYIFIGKNIGYGRGNNSISNRIKERSTYHLILNPDVYFNESVILSLIEKLKTNTNVSVIAPRTLYPNGNFQHSCRRYPTFSELLFRRLKVFKSITDKGEYKDIDLSKSFYPDFIQGAFLLFKTKDFIHLNGFDNRYFMYMEDVDICRKIDTTKKKKLYYPKVEVYHYYTQGSAKNIKLFFHHFLSAVQYFYKWNVRS